jgi:rhodanese-related sulfurtransferase
MINLKSIIIFISILVIASCTWSKGKDMNTSDLQQRLQQGDLTLIDIRTPDEWRATGVIPNALTIDMQHPGGANGFAQAVLSAVNGNKSAPIALICHSGNRSGQMQRELTNRGFTNVYNITGGMAGKALTKGWLTHGLPVEKCKDC